ncbi:MAG TPA: 4-(cytidine 5'-diphospho)-2-C-methyl-D-erythritol kinase [Limnochordia bacterium]|nr:4-(cytidine 5'-diphospho)-2-C-methyl-D-erythritol kinase [Limnochordia bacterium]
MAVEWIEIARAKVNLALHVGGLRDDGYHPVATVVQKLALHDELVIRVEPRSSGDLAIRISADRPGVPTGPENLAWRAVELLKAELRAKGYGRAAVLIHIRKRIPVAAGLGGGSADAAAVLAGFNRRLGLGLSLEALLEKAAALGSDVPACLIDGAALCTGRGEKVRPIASPMLWWVLAHPGGRLSTADVYKAFDALREVGSSKSESDLAEEVAPLVSALACQGVAQVARYLYNDLQEAASRLHSGIAPLLAEMRAQGAINALVSGSGPTVAGVMPDARTARRAAEALQGKGFWVWWGFSHAS